MTDTLCTDTAVWLWLGLTILYTALSDNLVFWWRYIIDKYNQRVFLLFIYPPNRYELRFCNATEDGTEIESVGHGYTILGWFTWVIGHCQRSIDPWWWNNCTVACNQGHSDGGYMGIYTPKISQVNLWGKNDVRTAIQQLYTPQKLLYPQKQISGYAPACNFKCTNLQTLITFVSSTTGH